MKEKLCEAIRKCRPRLVTSIAKSQSLDVLIDHLRSSDQNGDDGITEGNILRIRGGDHTDSAAKVNIFFDILTEKSEIAFHRFINAIIDSGKTGLIDILNSGLSPDQKISKQKTTVPATTSALASLSVVINLLRRIYSKSYRKVIPFSLPFFFDIERKWVDLSLKLEDDLTEPKDYAAWLKKAFAEEDMLIIEGDPGVGKSSLIQRIAYEWSQSRLSDYDFVLHIEFRKLREEKFKDIKELITHYMKGYLDEDDYEIFQQFISDPKCCIEHKILVLLDGYDESALEEQCKELTDYFNSVTSKPLRFNILITSRTGFLSKFRDQGRFVFADVIGFTTESQKQECISKHFNAIKNTTAPENTAAVMHLLNTKGDLRRLSETPLLLTFTCLTYKKIIDGTEVELYMNTIWWMIDRYQKSNPEQDAPSLFGFEHNASDKFRVIETNYQYFPQLHLLGTMAMQDIFKTTFTETDLRKFQLKEVVQKVGFLRKEETTDDSYRKKTEFSFLHRTIQEFMMALTLYFSDEEPTDIFIFYVFLIATNKGYGIIPAKIQTFLDMIYSSKIKIPEKKNNLYIKYTKFYTEVYSYVFQQQERSGISTVPSHDDAIHLISIPKSSEEAVQLLRNEAEQGDAFAQNALGSMYESGIFTITSDEEAIKWYEKSAEQGNANAQFNMGNMYRTGRGVTQSDEEAVKWFRKSAEQGHYRAQNNLGALHVSGKGAPQSDEEAVKWIMKAAEQGDQGAQFNLAGIYATGQGVLQSDKEAAKWCKKSAEQGNADAQFNLGIVNMNGQGLPQSDEEAVKWYAESAQKGNANAQYNLGMMYHMGRGVLQSDKEAVKWLTNSAEQGHASAQFKLGIMYKNGQDVSQSDVKAAKWYRKSAEQGNADAQYNPGIMNMNGQGVPQSDERAVEWYTKSAEQDHKEAQIKLDRYYTEEKDAPQSSEECVEWYKKAVEQGNAVAQFNLGIMYQNGKGVPKSDEEAVKWYRKSAEQGNVNAQYNLGNMYAHGLGVPQSDEAVKWFSKSAEQGHVNAQYNLGFMYENGKGVPHSDEEAVKWYRKLAEQKHAIAQCKLGFMYENGKGVPQSDEEAVKWYRKSAEQGNADGQVNLGNMHKDGRGVSQSDEEAVKWYRKAADQGNAMGQNNLGWMYSKGRGVLQSDEEAVKWYRKAIEQGNALAESHLKAISTKGQRPT